MDKVAIIDEFCDDVTYNEIKTYIFERDWTCVRYNTNTVASDNHTDPPYWKIKLNFSPLFSIKMVEVISRYFNKNFKLIRVYAVSQTYTETGSYHTDHLDPYRYTFCLYISDNVPTNSGGSFFVRIPNRYEIMSIDHVNNRGVLFPSKYLHKGHGFDRNVNDLRMCIAWKLIEIPDDFFFTKQLSFNNLQGLTNELYFIQDIVIQKCSHKLNFKDNHRFGKGSITTKCWKYYNLLAFNKPYISMLFKEIKQTFIQTFIPKELYHISMWLNIHKKGEFLDWHGHWKPHYNSYHGYYSVQSEPSTTSYKFPYIEDIYVHHNKNGLIVINKSDGDRHCVSEWKEDIDRISIAFDIVPTHFIINENFNVEYYMFPFIEEQDIIA